MAAMDPGREGAEAVGRAGSLHPTIGEGRVGPDGKGGSTPPFIAAADEGSEAVGRRGGREGAGDWERKNLGRGGPEHSAGPGRETDEA